MEKLFAGAPQKNSLDHRQSLCFALTRECAEHLCIELLENHSEISVWNGARIDLADTSSLLWTIRESSMDRYYYPVLEKVAVGRSIDRD